MTFINIVKEILKSASKPMTPQEISEVIKKDYPQYHGTLSHQRNVKKGYYKNIDHALLAQIYGQTGNNKSFFCNKTIIPKEISLADNIKLSNGMNSSNIDKTGMPNHNGRSSRRSDYCKLERPNPAMILEYLHRWDKLENYTLQEASLGLLFNELCPKNQRIEHVLLKVSALNDFYSTHIFDTFTVAKHILNSCIDKYLENDDYEIVNKIATITIKGKTKNFYSFASKYCSHHKPEIFTIYDSFVEKVLLHYMRHDNFYGFAQDDLKKYSQFIQIIKKFQQHYGLEEFSLRQIDIFLWLAGKEFFPKNY